VTETVAVKESRFVRVYLVFTALSVAVLAVLCVVLLLRVASVSERAAATAATSLKTCQAGNVSRQQSSDLWTGVLETPGSGIPKAALSHDLALVRKAYALRDCTALYGTK